MKHAPSLVLALVLVVAAAPAARADLLDTGGTPWTAWVTPTESGSVFWDNVSKDGTNCNVGFWVSGTGNCDAPVADFYLYSPNITPSFLVPSAQGFTLTTEPNTVTTLTAAVGVSALSGTTEFGWFPTSDPTDLHPLLTGQQIGSTVTISVPSGEYGFYLHVLDPRPEAVLPNATFYSNSLDAYGTGHTHFAAFNLGNGQYAIGIEDKEGWIGDPNWSDYDYNDLVILLESTPVPEPASMVLLGTGLLGLGAAARRRRRL